MKRVKKLSKRIIALIVCLCFIGAVLATALGMQIAFLVADKIQCWSPDYEEIDIEEILRKDELSDDDYAVLYRQTGLTKIGIDRCLSRGETGIKRILSIQEDYFGEYTVVNEKFAPYICTDYIEEKYITTAYLENGDVLVTSSTHVSGWRMGHAGLVTNGLNNKVLQASAYGSTSAIGSVSDFSDRVTFMILSPKVEQSVKEEVVAFALENLIGLSYDVTAGVFSSKNSVTRTQCAHVVWYAYMQFGIDLDYNGGLVVTPRDLARSPLMEVVQVFGFDPVALWN